VGYRIEEKEDFVEVQLSGQTSSWEVLRAVRQLHERYPRKEVSDLWIVSDEVYEHLIYDDATHHSPAGFSDDLYGRVIAVNAVSKTYAMTGWRIGYAAGPEEVVTAAARLQSNISSGPNTMAQWAAVEALTGPQDSVGEMRRAFDTRRKLMVGLLNEIPGVSCLMPRGAFYGFPNVSGLLGQQYAGRRVGTSVELSEALLDEAHVATVPGSAFGAEGYLRLSYATDEASIEEGLKRFAEYVGSS
jgi:aspartate aminotransferase